MSQTMATKHLAGLETRLGVRLLHRTTRRLTLTEAGRRYLDAVERILSDLEEAEAAVAIDRIEVRGTLRLSAPVSFGIREVAPLLPALLAEHPGLTIDLGLNDRHVDLIEEGWDLAVRIGTMSDSSLIARKLADTRVLVCAAPSYLKAHGTPLRVADLKAHNCLGYTLSRTMAGGIWSFGRDGQHKVPVTGSFKANNGDALVAAAAAGMGVICQPDFLVNAEIRSGRLVALALDEEPTALAGVFAVHPASRRAPAKVRACIDFLAARFAPVPPWAHAGDRLGNST
jgi:DNA-binding transcriptional LysR family regulator